MKKPEIKKCLSHIGVAWKCFGSEDVVTQLLIQRCKALQK